MLKLNNVTKIFAGNCNPVLNKLCLNLDHGDFCVVIGSNGSGKSTLMRCISGEYSANSGEIHLSGGGVIASVTQDINKGTIPEMTLLENMILSDLSYKNASLKFYQRYKEKIISIVKELGLELEKYINEPLSILSGGQRQMIATLMAISSNPDLLLLDEHTSALDPKTQVLLMEYTSKAITKNKITTIMVTHKFDDAIRYGNKLIMMHKGEIVFSINEKEKKDMTVETLLELFHKYEDISLRGEV